MLPSFCTQTVVVSRPTQVTDERGNPVQDHALSSEHLLDGCWVSRAESAPTVVGATKSEMRLMTLHAPLGSDITLDDRVMTSAGVWWDVVRGPRQVDSPTGAVSHVVVTLGRDEQDDV